MGATVDKQSVHQHFDRIADEYDQWKRKAWYYHRTLADGFAAWVPPAARVLEIGTGTGFVLHSLKPKRGLGIDISEEMVRRARVRFPELEFRTGDAETLSLDERFDYVIYADIFEHLAHPGRALIAGARALEPGGKMILSTVNPLWTPILEVAERLRLKMPEGDHHWVAPEELERLATEAGLFEVGRSRRMLVPKKVPLIADLANYLAPRLPLVRRLCLIQYLALSRV
jgi:ubiquinone/menaquinone biosynthesis C-methylase UbiE